MPLQPADLQRLLAEEPFVRSLAASLIADEADDVVQQAFLRAIEQRPAAVREPRSWLARIVRNLAADQRRGRQRREARQRTGVAAPHPLVPSAAEIVEAEEHRRALVAAVNELPEPLRAVVLLRYFEGLAPRHIARDLGVNVQVVWDRLHAALVALRARLDAQHGGDRRAWLLPLVPFATSPRALPWQDLTNPLPAGSAAMALGVIAMTTKTKLAAAAAVVLVAVLAWSVWPSLATPLPSHTAAEQPAVPVVAQLDAPRDEAPAANVATNERAAATSSVAALTTGDLTVTVRYDDAPHAAAGVLLVVSVRGGDFRVGSLRAITDAEGVARFEGLVPGPFRVNAPMRSGGYGKVEVLAGNEAKCELHLRRGFRLDGVVVDGNGVPVAWALVEATDGMHDEDATEVARTAADGTFVLRQTRPYLTVGARARGFAASQLHYVNGEDGANQHVRIELRGAGGAMEGVVVDATGRPIAGAVVRVGAGQTDAIRWTDRGAAPLPAQVRSDAEGRFVAIGVPPGNQPAMVRHPDFAPWRGTCDVPAGGAATLRVVLTAGVTCRGHVRDATGQPLGGVEVRVGARGEFEQFLATTASDGAYVLCGLPARDVELVASAEKLGKASARVRGEPGTEVQQDMTLSAGVVLRGRVVDEVGAPLRSIRVYWATDDGGPFWETSVTSDAAGHFRVLDCPAGRTFDVVAAEMDRVVWRSTRVDARGGELEIRLPKDTSPRARIVGRLLDQEGRGAVGVTVDANRYRASLHAEAVIADPSGSFVIEVGAGTWSFHVNVKDRPRIWRDRRELTAGEVWDLGTLQLVQGGTLVVNDDAASKHQYDVHDGADRFVSSVYAPVPPRRSELLVPGAYRLFVKGDGIAPQVLPFSIRAGEETVLDVRTSAGVRQRIEFVLAAGVQPPQSVGFVVRRDGSSLLIGGTSARIDPLAAEIWLAPGDYELVTREREPATTARFTVKAAEGGPVRIELH